MSRKLTAKTKRRIAFTAGGLAVTGAAAAAAYFLLAAKGASRRQRRVKAWVSRARREFARRLKQMPAISEQTYAALVGKVLKKYRGLKNIEASEILAMTRELRGHWKSISRGLKRHGKKVIRRKRVRRRRTRR